LAYFAASFDVFLVDCFWDWAETGVLMVQRLLPIDLSLAVDSEYFLIKLSIDRFANA
jgi:hypothetical protein